MWMLRLSAGVYKMARVLRVGKAVSHILVALCGIAAGSGFATTEMCIVLMRVIDAALAQFPTVKPFVYVDGIATEVVAPEEITQQQLSPTKSLVNASNKRIGVRSKLLALAWGQERGGTRRLHEAACISTSLGFPGSGE